MEDHPGITTPLPWVEQGTCGVGGDDPLYKTVTKLQKPDMLKGCGFKSRQKVVFLLFPHGMLSAEVDRTQRFYKENVLAIPLVGISISNSYKRLNF
jgi:hypothetical protein